MSGTRDDCSTVDGIISVVVERPELIRRLRLDSSALYSTTIRTCEDFVIEARQAEPDDTAISGNRSCMLSRVPCDMIMAMIP